MYLTEGWLWARHWAKSLHLACTALCQPCHGSYCHPHHTRENAKAWRGQGICSRSQTPRGRTRMETEAANQTWLLPTPWSRWGAEAVNQRTIPSQVSWTQGKQGAMCASAFPWKSLLPLRAKDSRLFCLQTLANELKVHSSLCFLCGEQRPFR